MHLADKLACQHIKNLSPYQSARRIGGKGHIWINANELPFASNDFVLDSSSYHRYPDHSPDKLMQAYAAYAGLPRDRVLATRGADEGIELLIRAFCYPGKDGIAQCPPTYGLYEISANIHHVTTFHATLNADFSLNLDEVRKAPENTRVVFLCNPNNPTGNAFPQEVLLEVVEHFKDKALVVVDEAYMEFSPDCSLSQRLKDHENLVILRTLSKAFGLAGVHLGFVLAQKPVLDVLNRMISPYPIAEPCAQIGLQALAATGVEAMQRNVEKVLAIRKAFIEAIDTLPGVTNVYPTHTNFVLAVFADQQAAWQKLSAGGIVARQQAHPMMKDCIRFSIGTQEEMTQCVEILKTC